MACLNPHITDLECLNEDDANTVQNLFQNNGAVLKSDTDQQLLIKLQFRQPVKISGKCKNFFKPFGNFFLCDSAIHVVLSSWSWFVQGAAQFF